MRRNRSILWVCVCAAGAMAPVCLGFGEQQKTAENPLQDEPEARALYEKMIKTMADATTLSYESAYRNGPDDFNHGTYSVWMKKPNYFYVEARLGSPKIPGVVVGDGEHAWSYWPDGRPWFSGEDQSAYQKTRFNVYMKEPAPAGKYSIRYSTVMKKSNHFPVLDPSCFLGVKDSLEPFIDWIRGAGEEKVGDEDCRVVEVSYMNHQRSCYFWISQRDNLPRRLKRVVHGTKNDQPDEEQWSRVTLNGKIPQEKFAWKPPAGWRQWRPPTDEEKLLKPGQPAPDFELSLIDGGKLRLSACRGKIVWLTFWRVQCPPCREEIPYLERLHREYKDQGLVVLGFDFADDVKSASDFLHEYSATFPCIVDSSDEAIKTGFFTYAAKAAPVNYIIDRDGKIASAWLGYEKGSTHGVEVLARLGLNVKNP